MGLPNETQFSRRRWLAGAAGALGASGIPLAACAAEARAYDIRVSRDAGCGCCHAWMELMARTGRFRSSMSDVADMASLKRSLGVPERLWSCHTSIVAGLIVEGHVPGADILRLVETRPAGIIGIAVPGMPLGSPGMEQPDGRHESFDVLAFDARGEHSVFARH
jgi:hypothetical protein